MGEVNECFYVVVCFKPNGETTVGWKGCAADGQMYGEVAVSDDIHKDIDAAIKEGTQRLKDINGGEANAIN